MARDDSAKAKKRQWSDWINARLKDRDWNAADLVAASGDVLIYGTVYNWTKGIARAEAEAAVLAGSLLGATVDEALEAAGYPILAAVFAGREIQLSGTPEEGPDPDVIHILGAKELPERSRARILQWWIDQIEEDRQRRIKDLERIVALQDRDSA